MNLSNIKRKNIIIAIALGIFFIIVLSIIFLIIFRPKNSTSTPVVPDALPTTTVTDEVKKTADEIPLIPTQSPEYLEKITREPFWEMLPYYQDTYKIEYFDSADKIVITTVRGTQNQTQIYQDAAKNWLEANGAVLNNLQLEYKSN
jgi:hypothetical protein